MTTALLVIGSLFVGFLSAFFWKNNNPVEEVSERIVERELGLPSGSIDLDVPEIKRKKPVKKTSKKKAIKSRTLSRKLPRKRPLNEDRMA